MTQLLEWREQKEFEHVHHQLARLDLLVLNELGYVPCSKVADALLFEAVSRAYERASLIVTANLPFESWTEVMGNERLTGEFARSAHPPHADSREKWRELAAPREQDNLKPIVNPDKKAKGDWERRIGAWAQWMSSRGLEAAPKDFKMPAESMQPTTIREFMRR